MSYQYMHHTWVFFLLPPNGKISAKFKYLFVRLNHCTEISCKCYILPTFFSSLLLELSSSFTRIKNGGYACKNNDPKSSMCYELSSSNSMTVEKAGTASPLLYSTLLTTPSLEAEMLDYMHTQTSMVG